MRYRLMASYLGASYQAAVGPSDRDVTLFAAPPPPEEHGFSPAQGGIWRKQVRLGDLDALWESRPIGSYHGEPCLVLDDLGDRLHIVYLGMDERRAGQLGYWQVDRGVFEVVVQRQEVTDLAEERHEFPIAVLLSTLPRALNAGDGAWLSGAGPAAPAAPQPGNGGQPGNGQPGNGQPGAVQVGAGGGVGGLGNPGGPAGPAGAGGQGAQRGSLPQAPGLPGRNAPQPAGGAAAPQPVAGPAQQQPTGPVHAQGAPQHMPPGMQQTPEAWQQPGVPQPSGFAPQPGTAQVPAAQVPAAQEAPNPQPPAAAAAWHGSPAADANGAWYYQTDNGAAQNGTAAYAADPVNGGGFPNGYGNALPSGYAQLPDGNAAQYAPPFPQQPAHAYQPGQPAQAAPQPQAPQPPLPQAPQPPQVQGAQPLRTSQPLQPLRQQPQPVQAVVPPPPIAPPSPAESTSQPVQFLRHAPSPQPAPHQAPQSPHVQPAAPAQYASPSLAPREPAPMVPAPSTAPAYAPSADSATTGPLFAAPPPSPATLVSPVTLPAPQTLPAPAPPPVPAAPPGLATQPGAPQPQSGAPQPGALSKLTGAVRGRRAARKPRIAMSAVFADLVDMADIPRSAYSVDEEVTGAICLFKTDGGYEVFSCAEDARHEVRFFEDEEAAYFYLFGVLSAEALRNGRLTPRRG